MALHAPGGKLLLLRNSIGADAVSWVEELDPESLAVRQRSADLATGPYWPGGMAILDEGAVIVVQGRYAHRLSHDLAVDRSVALAVEAPHNSFVVLDDGSLATKDLQRPDGSCSTLQILDPVTLELRAAPLTLPEPSVARLSAAGNDVWVVGATALHRVHWEPRSGSLSLEPACFAYGTDASRSFGWDPVLSADAVWWLDNGDHTYTNGLTMLGNGVAPGSVRLWRAPLDAGGAVVAEATQSVEVCGQPVGAITNPPLVDETRQLVLAYDSAHGVLAAFGVDDLQRRWAVPLATAQHLVLYQDTGEVLVNDYDRVQGDSLVVIGIADGHERARVLVGSPAQSVVFPAPGFGRDAYYVSLSTVARVEFGD